MRISWFIPIGRLEIYIGRRPHWQPVWRASRVIDGWGLWFGRWNVLACRRPPRRPHAEVMAELLAQAKEGIAVRAKAAAEAKARLEAAKERIAAKGHLYRVRPRAVCRAADAS